MTPVNAFRHRIADSGRDRSACRRAAVAARAAMGSRRSGERGQTQMMASHADERAAPSQPATRARRRIRAAAHRCSNYRDVADAEAEGLRRSFPPQMGRKAYTHHFARHEKSAIDMSDRSIYKRRLRMQPLGLYTRQQTHCRGNRQARPLSVCVCIAMCTSGCRAALQEDWDGPNARFGFAGSIGDEATCKVAGGYWIPLALGWMTHIYPNETEPDKIWIGEQMMTLNTAEVEHNTHTQQKH